MNYLHPDPKPEKRPPKERKPLRRRKYMVKRAPRRIARETPAESYYKSWIHYEPCVCGCSRPVQQSHLRDMTGMGRKEDNTRSIAMDADVHREWTEGTGRFAGLSKLQRFGWFTMEIARAHARLEIQHGCKPEDYPGAKRGRDGT